MNPANLNHGLTKVQYSKASLPAPHESWKIFDIPEILSIHNINALLASLYEELDLLVRSNNFWRPHMTTSLEGLQDRPFCLSNSKFRRLWAVPYIHDIPSIPVMPCKLPAWWKYNAAGVHHHKLPANCDNLAFIIVLRDTCFHCRQSHAPCLMPEEHITNSRGFIVSLGYFIIFVSLL